ncbi:MAG: hypothetical protein ACYDDF_06850 [Thermoplasmatota archaeon]
MSLETIALGASLSATISALYVAVGITMASAGLGRPSRLPLAFFSLLWFGLGALALTNTVWSVAIVSHVGGLPLAVTILQMQIVALLVACFGIVYYPLYILSGRSTIVWPVLGFYVAVFIVIQYVVAFRDPIGFHMGPWGGAIDYAQSAGWAWGALLTVAFLPPVAASLAFFVFIRHVPRGPQRVRMVAIASSFGVYFLCSLIAGATPDWVMWPLVMNFIAIASASAILATVSPPSWMRKRWALRSLAEDAATTAS